MERTGIVLAGAQKIWAGTVSIQPNELVLMQPFLEVRAQIDEVGHGLLIGRPFGREQRHKVMKARIST
jgi:hypothetical protein